MDFTPRCPTCRAVVAWEQSRHRPFCSERCQLIDLGQWTTEQYRVPGEPAEHELPDDVDDDESDTP